MAAMRTGVQPARTVVAAALEEREMPGDGRGPKVAENAALRERLESDRLRGMSECESAMRQTTEGAGSVTGIEGETCIGRREVNGAV